MSYLNKFNEESLETFCGQNEAEECARRLLAEADARIAELEERVWEAEFAIEQRDLGGMP